jgi:phosphate transport system protein
MPVRYEFERELNRLHKDIIKMGAFIEESISDMIEALKTSNIDLAKHIIKKDDLIDEMERKISRECLITIARQQPIATDLRDIASILKIATDLERIADHCEDISEYVIKLAEIEQVKELHHIPAMAEAVNKMISETIDAYVRKDLDLARKIIKHDDVIDKHFHDLVDELTVIMENDSTKVRACTNYLFISKYLERMADHATNIAEWIVYFVTGEIQ